jgi:hypothetical protein
MVYRPSNPSKYARDKSRFSAIGTLSRRRTPRAGAPDDVTSLYRVFNKLTSLLGPALYVSGHDASVGRASKPLFPPLFFSLTTCVLRRRATTRHAFSSYSPPLAFLTNSNHQVPPMWKASRCEGINGSLIAQCSPECPFILGPSVSPQGMGFASRSLPS